MVMPPQLPLFVYGTLRDGDIRALVIGREPALTVARAPGLVVVGFPGKSYPALVSDAAGAAEGLLLTDLVAGEWAALDAYEGADYERRIIMVDVDGVMGEAVVYWPLVAVRAGSALWSLDRWQRNHKAAFLIEEARGRP